MLCAPLPLKKMYVSGVAFVRASAAKVKVVEVEAQIEELSEVSADRKEMAVIGNKKKKNRKNKKTRKAAAKAAQGPAADIATAANQQQ